MKNRINKNISMCEKEMLDQLEDLIRDRKSFSSNNNDLDNPFQQDIAALEKIIHDYKVLRDAAYHSMEEKGENLCIWINENVKFRKVEILNIWETDYDDVRCNAILYNNKKNVANIIVSYDSKYIKEFCYEMYHTNEIPEKFTNNPFKTLIYDSFDRYLKLPKISKCSPLLKEIYDCVCESDASMCHITYDDWNEFYNDNFTEKDVDNLKKEVKELGLQDVITFDDGKYKILGYGDLETKFNDDRFIERKKEYER